MTYRVAIVGTGNVARQNYLPFLAQQDDLSLSYYNRTRSKAEACAAEFGGWVADSINELMAAAPDIIFLLSSETARYALASAVLAAPAQTPVLREAAGGP